MKQNEELNFLNNYRIKWSIVFMFEWFKLVVYIDLLY